MLKCLLCHTNFERYVFIEGKKRNLQNRKYCLNCTPFGKHNNKQLHLIKKNCTCEICGKAYKKNGKRCGYCCVKIRRARIKLAGIQLLGGKCVMCGWDKYIWALDFHHKDDKHFNISKKQNISWEKMKSEMQKCELLCANCHREKHCTKNDSVFLKYVFDYEGPLDLWKPNGIISPISSKVEQTLDKR